MSSALAPLRTPGKETRKAWDDGQEENSGVVSQFLIVKSKIWKELAKLDSNREEHLLTVTKFGNVRTILDHYTTRSISLGYSWHEKM